MHKYRLNCLVIVLLAALVSVESQTDSDLPDTATCGLSEDNRGPIPGSIADLGDYPWTALLEFELMNQTKFVCGGVLINKRYVLTAAMCIQDRDTPRLYGVRLGEYNLDTEQDCVDGICADPIERFTIEKKFIHPEFHGSRTDRGHNIGLLKLDRDVNITNYIRPICLPFLVPDFTASGPNETVVVSGWGRTDPDEDEKRIKQRISMPIVDLAACNELYKTARAQVLESELCAGTGHPPDACDGFAGAGLMKKVNQNWVLEGIMSYGPLCGRTTWPNVYVRVSSFENWIRNTIKT